MNPAALAVRGDEEQRIDRPQQALARLLDALGSVLLQVSQAAYTAKPLAEVSGSVGEHVRHVLDHVAALAAARPHGVLTYDRRERGTAIETDSLRGIFRLKAALGDLDDATLRSSILVITILERGQPAVATWSTLNRELAFVISHTIHHQALIATLLAIGGGDVPEAFGVAPSTPPPAHS